MIPNGKSKGLSPSHFDPKRLAIGTRVELEHTSDRRIAQRIAMDHLAEDPAYYRKLRAIHLDGSSFDGRAALIGLGIFGVIGLVMWGARKW